ncbi:hypothetical protein LDENG_00285070 [Lucifuga dentata]|nr:hypothetical protein LDENG_00285070 [Lucifuga dentata]
MLMGVIYCLNLEYPSTMKYSFEFFPETCLEDQTESVLSKDSRTEKQTAEIPRIDYQAIA